MKLGSDKHNIKKEPGDEANQEVGSSESQATLIFSYTYTVVTKINYAWLKIMNVQ